MSPYIHEKLTGNKLVFAFKKPFGDKGPIGDYDIAKHISGGRRLNTKDVKNIKEVKNFNQLKAFFLNSGCPFIVPSGWRHIKKHPQARQDRELVWWNEYSDFTSALKAQRKEMDARAEAAGKGKGPANAKGKGKGKAAKKDDSDSDDVDNDITDTYVSDNASSSRAKFIECVDCGGIFLVSDMERHNLICEKDQTGSDDSMDADEEEEQTVKQVLGPASRPTVAQKRRAETLPPRKPGKKAKTVNCDDESDFQAKGSAVPRSPLQPSEGGSSRASSYAKARRGTSRPRDLDRRHITTSIPSRGQTSPIVLSGTASASDNRPLPDATPSRSVVSSPAPEITPRDTSNQRRVSIASQVATSTVGREPLPEESHIRQDSARSIPTNEPLRPLTDGPINLAPPCAARRPRPRALGTDVQRPPTTRLLATGEMRDLMQEISCLVGTIPAAGRYFRAASERFLSALDVTDRDRLPLYEEALYLARNPQLIQPPTGGTDSMHLPQEPTLHDHEDNHDVVGGGGIANRVEDVQTSREDAQTSRASAAQPITEEPGPVNTQLTEFMATTMSDLLNQYQEGQENDQQMPAYQQMHATTQATDQAAHDQSVSVGPAAATVLHSANGRSPEIAPLPSNLIAPVLDSVSSPLTDFEAFQAVPSRMPPVPRRTTRSTSAMLAEAASAANPALALPGEYPFQIPQLAVGTQAS